MLSVALDESLSLRARGELVCSRQQISVTADFFVAWLLHSSPAALRSTFVPNKFQIARRRTIKIEFFRGSTAQTAASWNGIVHHVLFGDRSRFFHKLRILADTNGRLDREFGNAAAKSAPGLR